jgi:tetratricopeptide (TPR) repeat protein
MGSAQKKLKKTAEAIADYTRAIELKKDFAGAYHSRGQIYEQLEQYQEAIQDYKKVLELNPDNKEAAENLERCETRLEEK